MINETAAVSCYVDAAALLLMAVLLFLSERIRQRKTLPLKAYFLLCCTVTATCVFCFVYNAMYKQPAAWSHTVALIARSLRSYAVLFIVATWVYFVNSMLHVPEKRKAIAQRIIMVPVVLYVILLAVNLFTGIVFKISPVNLIDPKPLYYVLYVIEFTAFALSAFSVWSFDRRSRKIRFLKISPMIICVALSCLPMLFSAYDASDLGFAIGLTILYFSMITELRYTDEESGLYNNALLTYVFDSALAGKNPPRSALILELGGNLPAGFDILRDTLNQEGDVIRLAEKRFLMFSATDSRSELQMKTSSVEEAVNSFNSANPEEQVRIVVHCRIRTGDEDVMHFMRSAVEDRDAGDPVRGVASMISELDQLDKDLKLAADIQGNMLPMPLPDRGEFELHAIMDPAKEVGGDFYDFFMLDDDHLGLVIADVSGKGIPAALFMMVSKTLIKNQLMSGCDPATAVERVNVQLCERNSSMMFDTVWLAVIELSTGKGTACNAGHENPVVRADGGSFEILKYKHGMVVGVNRKATYQNREFLLKPGDCVFVYTDGVPEATNPANTMFGEERLLLSLNEDADASPEELITRIHDAVFTFADGAAQFDDITMLCMKYYGPENKKEAETKQ